MFCVCIPPLFIFILLRKAVLSPFKREKDVYFGEVYRESWKTDMIY